MSNRLVPDIDMAVVIKRNIFASYISKTIASRRNIGIEHVYRLAFQPLVSMVDVSVLEMISTVESLNAA